MEVKRKWMEEEKIREKNSRGIKTGKKHERREIVLVALALNIRYTSVVQLVVQWADSAQLGAPSEQNGFSEPEWDTDPQWRPVWWQVIWFLLWPSSWSSMRLWLTELANSLTAATRSQVSFSTGNYKQPWCWIHRRQTGFSLSGRLSSAAFSKRRRRSCLYRVPWVYHPHMNITLDSKATTFVSSSSGSLHTNSPNWNLFSATFELYVCLIRRF